MKTLILLQAAMLMVKARRELHTF